MTEQSGPTAPHFNALAYRAKHLGLAAPVFALLLVVVVYSPEALRGNLAWAQLSANAAASSSAAYSPGAISSTSLAQAFKWLSEASPANPSFGRGYPLALWYSGRLPAAIDYWQSSQHEGRLLPSEALLLGWGYEHAGEFQAATVVWKSAGVPGLYFHTLYTHAVRNGDKQAPLLRWAQLAAELGPREVDNWILLANEYERRSQGEQAEAAWRQAAELLSDSDPAHWYLLGRAYYALGNWSDARRAFARGVALDPHDAGIWRHYFYSVYWGGDYGQAAQIAMQWAAAMPGAADAYVSAVRAYYQLQDNSATRAWAERALAVGPDNAEAHRWRAAIAVRENELPLAEMQLKSAIALQPDYAEAHFELARVYALGNEIDKSLAASAEAVRLYSWGCPSAWQTEIGDWLAGAGRRDQAAEHYRAALACDPGAARARDALDNLEKAAP